MNYLSDLFEIILATRKIEGACALLGSKCCTPYIILKEGTRTLAHLGRAAFLRQRGNAVTNGFYCSFEVILAEHLEQLWMTMLL